MSVSTDVVVIGGGYAGVMAGNRLTKRDDLAVTLINPRPVFVERLRLHQLVGGSHPAVVGSDRVLAPGVRLVVDTATWIAVADQQVRLATGGALGYDYLIYAVGSGSIQPGVPGAAEFAYPISTLEAAQRLRAALTAISRASDPVTVVGAGATGIETAAELAELGHRVTLLCGAVLGPYLHPRARRSMAKQLARLGVTVLDGPDATVTGVTRDAVRLADGSELLSTVTIWTAGFGVPDLASRSGLRTDSLGRLLTDETLTSVDDTHIVAAGDAAAPSGRPFRMCCQSARPLGAHAADTVLSRIAGRTPRQVNVGLAGQCVGLGRRAATAQIASTDDVATGFYVGGRVAAAIKESASSLMVKELAHEAAKPGSFSWRFTDKKRQLLLQGEGAAQAENAINGRSVRSDGHR